MSENSENQYTNPSHYTKGRKIEPIEVILDWDLGFNAGNVVKYLARAGRKNGNSEKQDYSKLAWYTDRLINQKGAVASDVDKAGHYNTSDDDRTYEAIKVIEHYDLNFPVGNAVKYLLRAGRKSEAPRIDDINKAIQYLTIEKQRIESQEDRSND